MATRTPRKPEGFKLPFGGVPLKPIGFLGRTTSVEIWQVKSILFEDDHPQAKWTAMVGALARRGPGAPMWVGTIDIRHRDTNDRDVPFECMNSLSLVARETGVGRAFVWQISGAALDDRYKNKGIGIAMYLGAAMIAKRDGEAIAADVCFHSSTSDEAKRVWHSREFNKHVVRHGLVAALR